MTDQNINESHLESENTLPENMVPEGINEEVLIDQLDHEKNLCEVSAPKSNDHDEWNKVNIQEQDIVDEEKNDTLPLSLPDSEPEENEAKPKLQKLKMDYDETRVDAGFQDLRNAGKFWRAAQMMGTRKGNVYYLMCVVSSEPR